MARGRQAGQAYNRRSNAEIDRGNRGQEAANAASQATAQRRGGFMQQHFFAPAAQRQFRQQETMAERNNLAAAAALLPAAPPPAAPVARQIGRGIAEPTPENPLPGVDMRQVPIAFRIMVGAVMQSLRTQLKATRQSNQHVRYTKGSNDFPWATEEYVWPRPFTFTKSPTFADFLVPFFFRIRFFTPDKYAPHMLPTGQMPCKWHGFDLVEGKTCVCRDLVLNNFVRIFHDVDGGTGGMFSSRYICTRRKPKEPSDESDDGLDIDVEDNNYYFAGHCAEVLARLTPDIRSSLGLVLTKRCAVTTALADHIFEEVSRKMPFLAIRGSLATKQKDKFFKLQREFQAYYNNQTLQGTLHAITNNEFTTAMHMHFSSVVRGMFLSRQYVQQVYVSRVLALLPYYERCLQMMGGRILCADKSYKVIRFVFITKGDGRSRGEESVRAFDSVYTCMNEYSQIVSINFVRAGDYKEMETILKKLQHRYDVHGYDEVKLFYTDNCCHEYNMIVRAMPSVSQDDTHPPKEDPRRSLPNAALPPGAQPVVVTSYEQLILHCAPLLEVIDACDDSSFDLGFDVEWDSLTQEDLHNQIPIIMQLASIDPQSILVIRIPQVFPEIVKFGGRLSAADMNTWCDEHNILRRLLQDPKVRLVGVNVKGDITRVDKHYPEALFGSNLDRKIIDCAQLADKHALFCRNERRGLQSMVEKFLGLKMDKVSHTRPLQQCLCDALFASNNQFSIGC